MNEQTLNRCADSAVAGNLLRQSARLVPDDRLGKELKQYSAFLDGEAIQWLDLALTDIRDPYLLADPTSVLPEAERILELAQIIHTNREKSWFEKLIIRWGELATFNKVSSRVKSPKVDLLQDSLAVRQGQDSRYIRKLSKSNCLSCLTIELGWDNRISAGSDFDLELTVFMLNQTGQVNGSEGMIRDQYGESQCGGVLHNGYRTIGQGRSVRESITIDLDKIPESIAKLTITASIFEGGERRQNFGVINNAYVAINNTADGTALAMLDLNEDYCTDKSVIFGELYRCNGAWQYRTVGQGFAGELEYLYRRS